MNRRKKDPNFRAESIRPTLGDGYTQGIYPEDLSPDTEQMKLKLAQVGETAVKAADLREKFIQDNEDSFHHMGG